MNIQEILRIVDSLCETIEQETGKKCETLACGDFIKKQLEDHFGKSTENKHDLFITKIITNQNRVLYAYHSPEKPEKRINLFV